MAGFSTLETIGLLLWVSGMLAFLIGHIRLRGFPIRMDNLIGPSLNIFGRSYFEFWSEYWKNPVSRPWSMLTLLLCGSGFTLWMGEDFLAGKWFHGLVVISLVLLIFSPFVYYSVFSNRSGGSSPDKKNATSND